MLVVCTRWDSCPYSFARPHRLFPESAASRPGDPAALRPCLLGPFDVMQCAIARRQVAVPGSFSSLLRPLQLVEHRPAFHNTLLAVLVMSCELGAAGNLIFALCVAGFPESKRAVLTASLKHSFEAVGGSAVQITFEDTEVGFAHTCLTKKRAACSACTAGCTAGSSCLSVPFVPCCRTRAALPVFPLFTWLPEAAAPALSLLCCHLFCQRFAGAACLCLPLSQVMCAPFKSPFVSISCCHPPPLVHVDRSILAACRCVLQVAPWAH